MAYDLMENKFGGCMRMFLYLKKPPTKMFGRIKAVFSEVPPLLFGVGKLSGGSLLADYVIHITQQLRRYSYFPFRYPHILSSRVSFSTEATFQPGHSKELHRNHFMQNTHLPIMSFYFHPILTSHSVSIRRVSCKIY